MPVCNACRLCVFQTEYARFEGGRYVFRIHRSPLCEYMINFIHKLKHLPEKYMMNSVLENFTILQVKHLASSPVWTQSPKPTSSDTARSRCFSDAGMVV